MEEELAAGLRERQIAEFVEDDEIDAGEPVGDAALAAALDLGLELVDQVDDIEEARLVTGLMQLRAMAMAMWLLPVPVPPIRMTLRWLSRNAPSARSRTSCSLIGVPSKMKSASSLASGNLAIPIW